MSHGTSRPSCLIRFAVLAAVLLAALNTPPASAQTSVLTTRLVTAADRRPEISPADIAVIRRVFELGEQETVLLNDLYESHADAVREGANAVARQIIPHVRRAELVGATDALGPAREIADDWRQAKASLEQRFLDDLTILLTDDQQARWPILERELRRIRSLPQGTIRGESIDLTHLVYNHLSQELRDHPSLIAILDRYVRELDPALKRRDAYHEENAQQYDLAVSEDRFDDARAHWDEMRERRVAVRALNARTLEALLTAIQAVGVGLGRSAADAKASAEAFELVVLEQAVGWERQRSRTAWMIDAALDLGDLDEEQRKRLEGLRDLAERQRLAFLRAFRDAVFEYEATFVPSALDPRLPDDQRMLEPDRRYVGWPEGHPIREAQDARADRDLDLYNRLIAALTPEQRDDVLFQSAAEPIEIRSDATATQF